MPATNAEAFSYPTQLYTQAMYDRDYAASGGEAGGTNTVGQRYYDPQVQQNGGQTFITLADGTKMPYNQRAAGNGQTDFWKGMLMLGGAAATGGALSGAWGGAGELAGAAFDPSMFSGAEWAGSPTWGGAGVGGDLGYAAGMGADAGASYSAPEAMGSNYAPVSDLSPPGGGGNYLQQLFDMFRGGGNGGGMPFNRGGPFSNAFDLGQGAFGLYNYYQNKKKMEELARNADPQGPYRAQYASQLSQLMANPGSITSRPGYQFRFDQGQQAAQRAMAAQGYNASGNEKVALTQYGQNFATNELNQEIARLSGLAGGDPGNAANIGMQGTVNNTQLLGNVLGNVGYNIYRRGW